jgi:hypothetical protein
MELRNIAHLDCAATVSHRICGGSTYTDANTYAGPGLGLASANGYAAGRSTSVGATTYTSARTTPYSQNASGMASAYAYSNSDSSHALSASRYRSMGSVSSTSSFSTRSNP